MIQMSLYMMATTKRSSSANCAARRTFAACDEFYKDAVVDDWIGMDWLAGAGSKVEKLRRELERIEMRASTGVY